MSKPSCVESLLLVLPETAQQRGIRAEAPVCISPNIDRPHQCRLCTATFTPLVYQTGYTTQSQHYHETDGGIYYFVALSPWEITSLAERTGWLAFVEPVGTTSVYELHGTLYGRAEAVTVTAIAAQCMVNAVSDCCLFAADHRRHSLSAGALAESACGDGASSFLTPLCDADDPDAGYAPFTFQIQGGTVYFSRRS